MKKILLFNIFIFIGLISFSQIKEVRSFQNILQTQSKEDIINEPYQKGPCTSSQTNDNCSDATSITPNTSCINQTTCNSTIEPGEPAPVCDITQDQTVWYKFIATSTNMTVLTDMGSSSCFLTSAVYSGTCGSFTQINCQDNKTILSNFLVGLIIGDTYYIQIAYGSGGPCGTEGTFCINVEDTPEGASCSTANPFCTGSTNTFTADVGNVAPSGPDYNCLLSQPNPAWFYLEIDTGGDIEVTMTNSNTVDIDFIVWGPFSDVTTGCTTLNTGDIEDCSYSVSATEVANITGATTGEVYILLITNYSNNPTNISFSQTAGTGSTNCSILPVDFLEFGVTCTTFNWLTMSELNNNYFTVYHSYNNEDWNFYNTYPGKGNSNTPSFYEYHDKIKPNGYYRLDQTDYNGNTTQLGISYINCNIVEDIKLEAVWTIRGKKLETKYPTKPGMYILKYKGYNPVIKGIINY